MAAPEPVLTLHSECLLSKAGFNDGDDPDVVLDALDALGQPYPRDWHTVLRLLVREHLAPALDQKVVLVDVDTIHNPIRAAVVDGMDVVPYWTEEPPVRLTPESVDVPLATVLDLVRKVDSEAADFGQSPQTGEREHPHAS